MSFKFDYCDALYERCLQSSKKMRWFCWLWPVLFCVLWPSQNHCERVKTKILISSTLPTSWLNQKRSPQPGVTTKKYFFISLFIEPVFLSRKIQSILQLQLKNASMFLPASSNAYRVPSYMRYYLRLHLFFESRCSFRDSSSTFSANSSIKLFFISLLVRCCW